MLSKSKRFSPVQLFVILLLSSFLVVGAAGCGDNSTTGTKTGTQTIRVGYFPNITHVQPLVGLQDGTFERVMGDGVTIDQKTFNAGPAELEALLSDSLDIGYIGPGPAYNGYIKSDGKIRIVAGAANGGAMLVVRPEANIKTIRDLAGKKVAVPQFGNTQDISLRKLLDENGLKTADKGGTVQVLQVANPDTLALFSKGELDAALLPEPWGTRLLQQGDGQMLLDWDQLGYGQNYPVTVLVVRREFLEEHPDLVEKWLEGHRQVTEQIKGEPQKAKALLNQGFAQITGKPMPTELLDQAFTKIVVTNDPSLASIDDMAQVSLRNGYVKKTVPVEKLWVTVP